MEATASSLVVEPGVNSGGGMPSMALADLTLMPRVGFKGAATPDWLRQQSIDLPAEPNRSVVQSDGSLVASLSWDEHLILSGPEKDADLASELESAWKFTSGRMCYQLPRAHSHCWFMAIGNDVETMFSKICGVDLRAAAFADDAVAQTSLARLSAIIIRDSRYNGFHVLADSASAQYLWDCLLDAMYEWGGQATNSRTLRKLYQLRSP
ncbi:MAG: sarcosine oxidase [Pseudomonadales bacterium]